LVSGGRSVFPDSKDFDVASYLPRVDQVFRGFLHFMIASSFLLLALTALGIRLLPLRHVETGFDTYGHLYFAKEIRKQRIGPFGAIQLRVIDSPTYRHPFLWHWLLGLLPLSFDEIVRHQKWLNASADALFAMGIYWVAHAANLPPPGPLFVSMTYLFTPMWFSRRSTSPRLTTLTPRLFSELTTNVIFILLLVPFGLQGWLVLAMTSVLVSVVLLSSKFGVQAIFFLLPLTSLFLVDLRPCFALGLGVLLCVGFTGARFWKLCVHNTAILFGTSAKT
jgi:hypothetical protein